MRRVVEKGGLTTGVHHSEAVGIDLERRNAPRDEVWRGAQVYEAR